MELEQEWGMVVLKVGQDMVVVGVVVLLEVEMPHVVKLEKEMHRAVEYALQTYPNVDLEPGMLVRPEMQQHLAVAPEWKIFVGLRLE